MDGVLADVFSRSDAFKRKLIDALRNPRAKLEQVVGDANDRARALNEMTAAAGAEKELYGPASQALAMKMAEGYSPVGMIDPKALGIPVNKNGTVTLYHGTTAQAAPKIVANRELRSAGEPNVYLTTAKDAGYGDGTLVSVDVHPRFLNLDDEFPNGRMDFSIDAPSKAFKVHAAKIVEALRRKKD